MRLLRGVLAVHLAFAILASAGVLLWTRESYEKAIAESSHVFKAKVIAQSQQYFHKGKKVATPSRDEISKYIEVEKKLPVVHTKVTLQITSLQKGVSLEVGQRIEVEWKDLAFSMCPHEENDSLSGEERKWRKVGETFRILPEDKSIKDRVEAESEER